MKNTPENAKILFEKAKLGYKKHHRSINRDFYVPARLLFDMLCKIKEYDLKKYPHIVAFDTIFHNRLDDLIEHQRELDIPYLTTDIKRHIKSKLQKHTVYLTVPINRLYPASLPFGKTIKLSGAIFHHITKKQFYRKHSQDCRFDYRSKLEEGGAEAFVQ